MDFLHKGFVKAVFSEAAELNTSAVDMGSEMIAISIDEESVKRIPTAVGNVASAEVFVPVTATMQILKTGPADSIYQKRYIESGVIPGTVTLYDDVNRSITLSSVSMSMGGYSSNASEAHRSYAVKGNLAVNTELIAQLGGLNA